MLNLAEVEAIIELAWQARHGDEDNVHAAISRLRALADDAPEDKTWRYAVRQAIADNGSVPCPDDDAEMAVARLLDVARKAVMCEAVNCTYQQPDLAELICRHKFRFHFPRGDLSGYISAARNGYEDFITSDPASLRAAIERLVGRIEG
jgi:hypothetical protein